MARVHYIGDEATGAGTGSRAPKCASLRRRRRPTSFRRAIEAEADLILLSADVAAALPRDELEAAVLGDRPLVAIVPDVHGRHPPPDVARDVRMALGIEP